MARCNWLRYGHRFAHSASLPWHSDPWLLGLKEGLDVTTSDEPWWWEEVDSNRTGVSGDFAKEFKNEVVKEPGVFEADHIPAEASLLVREAIQNSWDAARERYAVDGAGMGEAEPFAVRFRFAELAGVARDAFCDELGLGDLADCVAEMRYETGVDPRGILGLSELDCLSSLRSEVPLRLLQLVEEHGGGMGGPWRGGSSKPWRAMCSLGITRETSGHGGSYGYGKAGLIRGSRIRTVVAYTCFRERQDEPGVTRRLLGMTYWGSHRRGECDHTGTRWFGAPTEGGTRAPLINDAADVTASRLGMAPRDPRQAAQLGTTLLVVDPTVQADDLLRATERFWWPALEDSEVLFDVSVVEESDSGAELFPRPKSREDLQPFINSFERALSPPDSRHKHWRVHRLNAVDRLKRPGTVALEADTRDTNNWTFPHIGAGGEEGNGGAWEHRSLVALVRGPRMVVEYFDAGGAWPFVRGTFVASDEADDALRATEPKAHDAWHIDPSSGDVPTASAELAATVQRVIRPRVNEFRNKLKPDPPPSRELKLPIWDELAQMLSGTVPGSGSGSGPEHTDRPFSIHPGERLAAESDGRIRIEGVATVAWNEGYESANPDGAMIEVRIRYNFEGADRKEALGAELIVDAPEGFEETTLGSGRFKGELLAGETARFEYVSGSYDPEWTGSLSVEAEVDETKQRDPVNDESDDE